MDHQLPDTATKPHASEHPAQLLSSLLQDPLYRSKKYDQTAGPILDNEQINIIWNEYKEQREWQRHNEAQRAHLSQFLLTIAAALTTFQSAFPSRVNWTVPIFIIIVGIFGLLAVIKYWERFMQHVQLERIYRKILDSYFLDDIHAIGEINFTSPRKGIFIQAREYAKEVHNKDFPALFRDENLMQHWLWAAIFVMIIGFGVLLLVSLLV